MMRGVCRSLNGPEILAVRYDIPIPQPHRAEILVKVICTTANRLDFVSSSPDDDMTVIGCEIAGYVYDISQQKNTTWQNGDRVMALVFQGGNAEYTCVPEYLLIPIPLVMSFSIAASIPDHWLTAYQIVYKIASIQYKDTVLIHSANSGIGTAAIQLCSIIGACCIACVNSDEQISHVIDLGATKAFNGKSTNISEAVMRITRGVGVNVILDNVGALAWETNTKVIATDGKWVIYSLCGGAEMAGDLSVIIRKRITIFGTELKNRSQEYKTELINDFKTTVLPRLENGRISPVIDRVMPLSDISKAHMVLEAGKNVGKIVIEVCKETNNNKLSYRLPD